MTDPAPRLSVCIIARNEAERLPLCLASVAGVADEVLVTDTGSTDNTVALAQSAGASVDHFEWVDDFSAAYNHCVSRASGDWVFLIDADEALMDDGREELLRLIRHDDAFAYTVLRRDLYDASLPEYFTEMVQTRIFRPRATMRFVGRIHHQFTPPIAEVAAAEGRKVFTSTVRLRHDGYAGSDKRPKLLRAERLMTLELKDRPDRFYYLVELGRTRIALGDDSGVDLLRRAAEKLVGGELPEGEAPGQVAMLLEHVLACDVLPGRFPLLHADAEQLATKRFPNSPPLLWQRALREFKSQRFAACAKLLESLLELKERDEYDRIASFDPRIMGTDAILNLAVCYANLGRPRESLRLFDSLSDDPRHGATAKSNAAAIRKILRR